MRGLYQSFKNSFFEMWGSNKIIKLALFVAHLLAFVGLEHGDRANKCNRDDKEVVEAGSDVPLQPGYYPKIVDPVDAYLLEEDGVEDYEGYADSNEAQVHILHVLLEVFQLVGPFRN